MKRATTFLSLLALSAGLLAQSSVKTERQYLSGRGCDEYGTMGFHVYRW